MNRMTAIQRYFLLVLVCAVVVACKDDDKEYVEEPATEVTFTTTVQTRAVTNVVTKLDDGDAMNVFMAEETADESLQQARNYKAVCQGGVWKGVPAIEFGSSAKGYLYAVYPYQETSAKMNAVPVDITSQTDYLYSGNGVAVSRNNPKVVLTMKHALAALAFNIKNDNYAGEGKLEQISISGKPVCKSGTLDVSSGAVKGTVSAKYEYACNVNIQQNGWEENIPAFFCIPFVSSGSDVTVTFKIDGEDYPCQLPKYGVAGGMKYIFYLSLTEGKLTLFPEQTKQISLNVDSDSMSIPNYSLLKIVHDNALFILPSFKGEGIVGTILWGDEQSEEYGATSEHSYENGQSHTVTVETWGTEEVSLSSLVGISEIDLSDF